MRVLRLTAHSQVPLSSLAQHLQFFAEIEFATINKSQRTVVPWVSITRSESGPTSNPFHAVVLPWKLRPKPQLTGSFERALRA
jgi:hypothetical protein